jgi:hypothetical protein
VAEAVTAESEVKLEVSAPKPLVTEEEASTVTKSVVKLEVSVARLDAEAVVSLSVIAVVARLLDRPSDKLSVVCAASVSAVSVAMPVEELAERSVVKLSTAEV